MLDPKHAVRAAESAGEFVSQKTVRKVQREFSVVYVITPEALRGVELKGMREEEEMGHKTAQERCCDAFNSTKS